MIQKNRSIEKKFVRKISIKQQLILNSLVLVVSNGSTPSRTGNDSTSLSYEFALPNNNIDRTTPNSSLLTGQTSPPPALAHPPTPLQQQSPVTSAPPPAPLTTSSSYISMSPRNQYTVTNDSSYLHTSNQVFVFTTQIANDAAESVLKNEHSNIIEYHKSLPSTVQYLSVS